MNAVSALRASGRSTVTSASGPCRSKRRNCEPSQSPSGGPVRGSGLIGRTLQRASGSAGSPSCAGRLTSTGRGHERTTSVATLPSVIRARPVRPCVLIASSSGRTSSTTSRIAPAGYELRTTRAVVPSPKYSMTSSMAFVGACTPSTSSGCNTWTTVTSNPSARAQARAGARTTSAASEPSWATTIQPLSLGSSTKSGPRSTTGASTRRTTSVATLPSAAETTRPWPWVDMHTVASGIHATRSATAAPA